MSEVEGKVAFITGGSSGIGLGIARAFFDAGMKIVIGYRTKAHLDAAMKCFEGAMDRVHAISVDVTDRPGMEKAARKTVQVFGKVHVLVNNAGVVVGKPVSSTTYDDWDWVINVNQTGVFNGIHAFLPYLKAHGEGGHIVTTSSMEGLYAQKIFGSYTASKFAVVGLMEALRAELADTPIGVSLYCPGWVVSDVGNADRNRPGTESATAGQEAKPASISSQKDQRDNDKYANLSMGPLDAGRLVLRGMRNDDLYILTHPEFEQVLRDRNDALMASIPTDVPAPAERVEIIRLALKNTIYTTERARKRAVKNT